MSRRRHFSQMLLQMRQVASADFRSDTVTLPCGKMRKAMSEAVVGDDVLGEDRSITRLEKEVAAICNKEDSLFMCSGTMSNQIGLRLHVKALESVLCDRKSHVFAWEAAGVAAHSQAQLIPIESPLTAKKIKENIVQSDGLHSAFTTTVSLENTLLGSVMPLKEMQNIAEVCKGNPYKSYDHNQYYNRHSSSNSSKLFPIAIHLDGARLWNASIASGVSIEDYAKNCDTVSLCLSKGLGAPVGSVLVGTRPLIEKARHYRKMFGGGWRQAGILAAAGLYAIENNWKRMKDDHRLAARLAYEFQHKIGLTLAHPLPETNIVWVDNSNDSSNKNNIIVDWKLASTRLAKEKNIIIGNVYNNEKIRFVTHLDVNDKHVDDLIEILLECRK